MVKRTASRVPNSACDVAKFSITFDMMTIGKILTFMSAPMPNDAPMTVNPAMTPATTAMRIASRHKMAPPAQVLVQAPVHHQRRDLPLACFLLHGHAVDDIGTHHFPQAQQLSRLVHQDHLTGGHQPVQHRSEHPPDGARKVPG